MKKCFELSRYPEVGGHQCRVLPFSKDFATRQNNNTGNLFVKHVQKDVTHSELYDAFKDFGEIRSAKISINEDYSSRGYGFVQFTTDEEADRAIASLDKKELRGSEIFVSKYLPKDQRNTAGIFNNLYVKDFPDDSWTDVELKALFSTYGEVSSCWVPLDEEAKPKGFGFVCFKDANSAKNAMELNGREENDKKLVVVQAMKKEVREKILKRRREQYKNSLLKFNLYVREFGMETTEEELKKWFEQFGEVRNVKIMTETDANG